MNDAKLKHHENLRGMRQAKEKERTDKSSRTLEQLSLGQTVLVQDHKTKQWFHEATIVEKRSRRSYLVEMDGRQHLTLIQSTFRFHPTVRGGATMAQG